MNKRVRERQAAAQSSETGETIAGQSFWIVGIGASAGGLVAITEVLRPLPDDLQMAFVVMMHLDPTRASGLSDLLGRAASMPVVQATDALVMEAGHVYVLPPSTYMIVQGDSLRLVPRDQSPEPHHPIDLFLRSLAQECGSRSIGVVLSGTGTDGTCGLEAVRAAGGITFAQDASAEHSDMPCSAVAAGCVDAVLSTDGIARDLVQISRDPSQWLESRTLDEFDGDHAEEAQGKALDELVGRLSRSTGIDFRNYKQSTIRRRIQRRIVILKLDRLEDYLKFFDEHPDEAETLCQEILIHVTSFFRDPEVFEALERKVFPKLLEGRLPDEELRIWVPGCATGEEVYSLAIVLLEFLAQRSSNLTIKLFGTDVSEMAINHARAGQYSERIRAEVSQERLRQFFVQDSEGYVIAKAVRDLCVFARQDATRDPPFSKIDLISCRNLLIYLGPALQRRVLPIFHYALREGGFLLLGTAESVGAMKDRFTAVDGARSIFSRKAVPFRLPFDLARVEHSARRSGHDPALPSRRTPSSVDAQREADRALLAKYAPPGVVIDEGLEILQFRGDTGSFLVPAPGAPSNNLLRMAREGLLTDLRAIVEEGKASTEAIQRTGLRIRGDGREVLADIELIPLRVPESVERCFLILFKERPQPPAPTATSTPQLVPGAAEASRIAELQRELHTTRDYLRANVERLETANEDLRSSNEEVLSSNEELVSTNEELQTAKEELQATNEELLTVNEELQHRNHEVTLLGDDLANLLNSVQIPMVMVGPDLRIRRFTQSAAKAFGLVATDVNRSILDARLDVQAVDLAAILHTVIETSAPIEREVQDREGRWSVLTVRPYRTQEKKVDGAVVALTDIDARKRMSEDFERARDYAQAVVMAMREPLLVLDADLKVQQSNRAYFEAFPSTTQDLLGSLPSEAGGAHWATGEVLDALVAFRDRGATIEGLAVQCDVPGRRMRFLRLNARSVPGDGEREALTLLAIDDVTDREQQREEHERFAREVQDSQRLESLGVLAGGVAHDFNNILTAILGFADLLAIELPPSSNQAKFVGQIVDGARRAAELCSQMLAYSGRGHFQIESSNLNSLVRKSTPLLEAMIGKKARLRYELSPELPSVNVDVVQMGQVIANLILNASEALGGEEGEIVVSTGVMQANDEFLEGAAVCGLRAGRYVFLEVADTGQGMTAEVREHLFDPFFTTKFAGRGLGLAVVLGIARGHGGTLTVRSELGRGSALRLLLQVGTIAVLDVESVAAQDQPPWRGSGTALVVDDEPEVRAVLRTMLEHVGMDVVEAGDGRRGIAELRDHAETIRVVLLDLTMPVMGGRDAFVTMRELRPDLRVILMSGYEEQESVESFPDSSLSGFLRKPFTLGDLSCQLRLAIPDLGGASAPEATPTSPR
ncbi:chemotaxis protein CheB [Engelhardtia mirabilis]|uniref:Blue-light-activated protein n=1 Tax=Engelhardtia mirabilis TaxID=2528011 RepID=A0A518BMM7_9BACT|nr:Blue-light-activated protein [Planctomycetes bacterium Pla133]QDV02512.1 Blue-light-activated protein [Planctomycetes bacterium Pla86]